MYLSAQTCYVMLCLMLFIFCYKYINSDESLMMHITLYAYDTVNQVNAWVYGILWCSHATIICFVMSYLFLKEKILFMFLSSKLSQRKLLEKVLVIHLLVSI
jgi:hypothetical protein